MNLAIKDIQYNLGRFLLTALGVGMLLMMVMGMVGIYRGMIQDATLLIDEIGAEIWVVQIGTKGPFAEMSRVPRSLADRVAVVPGVRETREFVYHTIQRDWKGRSLRVAVLGLSWPIDRGEWLPLIAGRPIGQSNFEMIADRKTGLELGDELPLGREKYRVVGLTSGMVSSGGDGMSFFTVVDALAVQLYASAEAIRLEREARLNRAKTTDLGFSQPFLLERAVGPSSAVPALARPQTSAVIAKLAPGADLAVIKTIISSWADVTYYSEDEQRQFMLKGTVEMARKQIGLFTVLLTVISAIIMALILYTLTLEKIHEIALLKLIGAPGRVVLAMILEQALFLGVVGYALAYVLGQKVFPRFPRRVILLNDDLVVLALIVLAISVLSSLLGIWKAMRVDPNEALSG
ncbi:MAG: ABC transporter permease [Proteobacteria bacterium]|nr:ABC transporter permease [Pseudomonadota bacterium]